MKKGPKVHKIEAEFEEPIYDVIMGFREMGYTIKDIAEILETSRNVVYRWMDAFKGESNARRE